MFLIFRDKTDKQQTNKTNIHLESFCFALERGHRTRTGMKSNTDQTREHLVPRLHNFQFSHLADLQMPHLADAIGSAVAPALLPLPCPARGLVGGAGRVPRDVRRRAVTDDGGVLRSAPLRPSPLMGVQRRPNCTNNCGAAGRGCSWNTVGGGWHRMA